MARIIETKLYHFGEYVEAVYIYSDGTIEKETFSDWIQ